MFSRLAVIHSPAGLPVRVIIPVVGCVPETVIRIHYPECSSLEISRRLPFRVIRLKRLNLAERVIRLDNMTAGVSSLNQFAVYAVKPAFYFMSERVIFAYYLVKSF